MVSHDADKMASRERLLVAAAAEFAARGFAGAKVDRIAAKAGLNKAMIYYHFRNKAALYREILAGVFRSAANAVAAEVRPEAPVDDQVRQFVRAIAREAAGRPHFASMWLRELADGGTHIDPPVLEQMRRVLAGLSGIIARGIDTGDFRPVQPLVVQLTVVGPILMLAASAPTRDRLSRLDGAFASAGLDDLLPYIECGAIGALRGLTDTAVSHASLSGRSRT